MPIVLAFGLQRREDTTEMNGDIAAIRQAIRDIPNFPKPGITFKDITPLLANGPLFGKTIDLIGNRYREERIDIVLGIESRGFIIGAALAYQLKAGFSVVGNQESCPMKPIAKAMSWSMVATAWKSISMRSHATLG